MNSAFPLHHLHPDLPSSYLFTLEIAFRESALQGFLLALPVPVPALPFFIFIFLCQGHFPYVTADCGKASDTNPKLLNKPKGSTDHVKSTIGQQWHSSQLLALSESVISALSNVL